jgi:hypothetical protein
MEVKKAWTDFTSRTRIKTNYKITFDISTILSSMNVYRHQWSVVLPPFNHLVYLKDGNNQLLGIHTEILN